MRTYRRKWYASNKEYARQKAVDQRQRSLAWFREHKATLKCSRCPENHPATLDFHHEDPTAKEINIGTAVRQCWSVKRIEAEMAKCIVLCANCHRKLHASLAE